jgi:serine/threonine protein phosphatase PrpC
VPVGPLATALVAWAVEQGGADNISVALARVE